MCTKISEDSKQESVRDYVTAFFPLSARWPANTAVCTPMNALPLNQSNCRIIYVFQSVYIV